MRKTEFKCKLNKYKINYFTTSYIYETAWTTNTIVRNVWIQQNYIQGKAFKKINQSIKIRDIEPDVFLIEVQFSLVVVVESIELILLMNCFQ